MYLLNDPGPYPDVELVFMHGLRVTEENDAYWNTWLARDGTGHTCWPATWLQRSDSFPVSARVLSLNYDSSAKRSAKKGRFDLVSLGESLLQEMFLVDPKIGQSNCPVVFVCHSFGGIVAKKIVLTAKRRSANDKNANAQNLLRNLLGFFYYATPHSGSTLFKELCQVPSARQGPLLKFSEELDTETSRVNGEFQSLKNSQEYKDVWKFYAVAESCAIVQNVTASTL